MRYWVFVLLVGAGLRAHAVDFVVTNLADVGAGSLRTAIFSANTTPAAPHRIIFNVPSPFIISPASAFNTLTNSVLVDASTQPGYTGRPIVRLSGTAASPAQAGLVLTARGGGVRGLQIESFPNTGIWILGTSNRVEGCYLFSNQHGVVISHGGMQAVIGGSAVSNRNIISGNRSDGIFINATNGRNQIMGNYIGTPPTGAGRFAVTNNFNGIQLVDSPLNQIGGTNAAQRNVIAGNSSSGLTISGPGAFGNSVAGNYVGLDATGTNVVGNEDGGLFILQAPSNTVGGSLAARNYFSGNSAGVYVDGSNAVANTVANNIVGLTILGGAAGNTVGMQIGSANNVVRYNVISANAQTGLEIFSPAARGNQVYGNIIGLDEAGFNTRSNGQYGVYLRGGASSNRIGLALAGATNRNVISGNGLSGVAVNGIHTTNNVILNSLIGTDLSGFLPRPNQYRGIWVNDAVGVQVGDPLLPGWGNLISANVEAGVLINGVGSQEVAIEHNFIGTDIIGTGVVGTLQSSGIKIEAGTGHRVGPGANLISGNAGPGVLLSYVTNIVVSNNFIGCNVSGGGRLPNGNRGVYVFNARNISILNNVISGNSNVGVFVLGPDSSGIKVAGNHIGVGATGSTVVSNELDGIHILNTPQVMIGGTNAADRNVISGNGRHGIRVESGYGSTGTVVAGNYIGLNASGTTVLPNQGNGVHGEFTHGIQVGGPSVAHRNVIAGNQYGIYVNKGDQWTVANNYVGVDVTAIAVRSNRAAGIRFGSSSFSNVVERNLVAGNNGPGLLFEDQCRYTVLRGNRIGLGPLPLQALPNEGAGIFVSGCEKFVYGGLSTGDANRIAFNRGAGIAITSIVFGLRLQHEIYGNLIYSNAGLAIDLNADGVTTNDPIPDSDGGYANNFQNHPELTSAVQGSTIVSGRLLGDATRNPYRIEFFASSVTQGMLWVGATNLVLPGHGTGTFTFTFAASPPTGSLIYATASTTNEGTSELSPPILLTGGTLDTDGDLMPDFWESAYGLNPGVSNPVGSDADSDGFTDLEEWIADTLPNSTGSFFRITAITGGTVRVVLLPSSATRMYRLDAADALISPLWTTLRTNVPGSGGVLGLDDVTGAGTHRFYRVGVKLP